MKKIHKVEVIVVVLMICILIGISVPKFLHSQRNAVEHRVQSGLDTLFTALKAYANDYDGLLPGPQFQFPLTLNQYPHAPQFKISSQFPTAKDYSSFFRFLPDNGYLSGQQFEQMTEKIGWINDEYTTNIFHQLNASINSATPTTMVHNIGVAVLNPLYDYKEAGFKDGISAHQTYGKAVVSAHPDHWKRFVHPEGYFHTSNGTKSFGLIYQDFLGNKSTED